MGEEWGNDSDNLKRLLTLAHCIEAHNPSLCVVVNHIVSLFILCELDYDARFRSNFQKEFNGHQEECALAQKRAQT